MHELVILYNKLTRYNSSAQNEHKLSLEIWTHPISIVFWDVLGNEVKQCDTFENANKWLARWSR